jgi:hypothetical protein
MTSLWKPQNGFHRDLEISRSTRDSHIPTADCRWLAKGRRSEHDERIDHERVSAAALVVAGFELSINGRFSAVHRGFASTSYRMASDSSHRDIVTRVTDRYTHQSERPTQYIGRRFRFITAKILMESG